MDNVVRRWRKDFKLERIKTDKNGNRLYRAAEKATEWCLESAEHLEENTAEKKKCWECKYSYQDFTWEYQCTLGKEYPNGKEINGDSDACEHFS